MSGWLVLTKELHRIGGGPARLTAFGVSMNGDQAADTRNACARGVMRLIQKSPRLFELTPLGRDLCEGRAVLRTIPGTSRRLEIVPVIADEVPDDWIEGLLLESGHQPGTPISPDVLRSYSAKLVKVAREVAAC